MVKIDKDSIDGENLDGIWPLRLLCIEDFTSYEGTGPDKNIYNGHEAPEYNVLSYTWGRWRQDEGPRLPVKGINWTVPSVQQSCFTVEDFRRAIKTAAQDVNFVWVDVFCIDQDDPTFRAFEIGRQAGIFQGAQDYYMWLHNLSSRQLDISLRQIIKCERELKDRGIIMADEKTLETSRWHEELYEALSTLLSDNWFSSLWTLQEAQLGGVGRLMSRDASVIGKLGTNKICSLYEVSKRLGSIYDKLVYHGVGQATHSPLRDLYHLIEKSGLVVGMDSLQLYFAAGNRTTLYPEDRIYGIMQVFNLRLGKVAEPQRDFTLAELEVQFALALHKNSPLMAQLFRHVQPATEGRAWCVTQSCVRPYEEMKDLFITDPPSSECEVRRDGDGRVRFFGTMYDVEQMLLIWRESESGAKGVIGSPTFVLDAGQLWDDRPIESLPQRFNTMPKDFRHRYRVLLLGMIPHEKVGEHGCYDRSAGPEYRYIDEAQSAYVGMIVERTLLNGEEHWRRVGLALWPYDTETMRRHRAPQSHDHGGYLLA